jgi:outer membrane protein
MVDALVAEVELDESLLRLARDRREAGVGTGLDVTRSESRLATDRHRLLQARNESRTAEYRLLRAMGVSMESSLDLVDAMDSSSNPPLDGLSKAIESALQNRPEMKSQAQKVESARLIQRSAKAERLPSAQMFANYGSTGNSISFVPTHVVGVQVNLPIFDGGRRSAHTRTAESQLRQAEAHAKDVRAQIEMEVRVTYDTLASAREQLAVARTALGLAQEELDVSRLRFEAQVTTQIDVLSAQAELASARSLTVDALFAVRSAEIEYLRALHLGNTFNDRPDSSRP